jgi:hypothetical protein
MLGPAMRLSSERELGRRRHRRITGPSGWLLLVCMFLPAVKGCHAPIYPLEMPMFLPPYLYGLVLALGAVAATPLGVRLAIGALRAITVMTVLGSAAVILLAPPIGVIEMVSGLVVLTALGWGGHSEVRAAAATGLIGLICVMWFGAWASTSDALVGVQLSLVGSVGVTLGGLVWLVEAIADRPPAIHVPRAVARRPG